MASEVEVTHEISMDATLRVHMNQKHKMLQTKFAVCNEWFMYFDHINFFSPKASMSYKECTRN